MHICVIGFAHSISDSRVYNKEAISLRDAGHRVTLIARDVRETEDSNDSVFGATRPGHRNSIEHILFPHRPRALWRRLIAEPLWLWRYLLTAWRIDADVYHCHEPQSLFLAFLITAFRHRPVVYDCHEYQPESTAEFFGKALRPVVFPIFRRMERIAARRCAAVVTVNEELGDRFRKDCGRVAVLPNYPLRATFEAQGSIPDDITARYEGKCVVLYHGTLSRPRGLLTCIDFIKALRARIPNAVLLVIGPPSTPKFMAELQAAAAATGLEGGVQFHSWMSHEVLLGYLLRAEIGLFLPTPALDRYQKAEPVKYFEYAACRVPVVMSDVPALRTLIETNHNGIVVDPGDIRAAADTVADAMLDGARWEAMAEKGRQAFIERLCWGAVAGRLLAIYKDFEEQTGNEEERRV